MSPLWCWGDDNNSSSAREILSRKSGSSRASAALSVAALLERAIENSFPRRLFPFEQRRCEACSRHDVQYFTRTIEARKSSLAQSCRHVKPNKLTRNNALFFFLSKGPLFSGVFLVACFWWRTKGMVLMLVSIRRTPPSATKPWMTRKVNVCLFFLQTNKTLKKQAGCFSVPGAHGIVRRWRLIVAKWTDKDGEEKERRLSDWPARVWQHETDHTFGFLYDDERAGKCLLKTLVKERPVII
jgi:hypothetical protein